LWSALEKAFLMMSTLTLIHDEGCASIATLAVDTAAIISSIYRFWCGAIYGPVRRKNRFSLLAHSPLLVGGFRDADRAYFALTWLRTLLIGGA
jgi:hypothetical protein